ncbi:MAG: type 4a pilus biogenesis protein PilO [Verrucomicrobiota bacterium]
MMAFLQRLLALVRRNPVLVASIVTVVLSGTASWFLWQYQQRLNSEHDTAQRDGEAMLLSLNSHARVSAELAKVSDALAYIDRHLINEGDLAENLGYFYEIEAASRIKFAQVSQMSSQPQAADKPFKAVPFNLRTTGSYRQLLRVVRELENGPRLLAIRTFSLDAEGADPDKLTLDLTVELLARP